MKKYFTLAAVATMFAACSNEVIEPQVDVLTGMPIQVKVNVAELVESRVAGNDEADDVSTYILDIQPQEEGGTDYYVWMKKVDGEWNSSEIGESQTLTACDMVWANSKAVTVSALVSSSTFSKNAYRAVDTTNEKAGACVMVKVDQSTAASFKASDYLYMAPTTVDPTTSNGAIEVNVAHLMSKLIISVGTENEVTGVTVSGTYKQRYFRPTVTEEADRWGGCEVKSDIKACKDETTGNYEVILVPQTVAANTFSVSFTMGEQTYKWTSTDKVTLESGKLYTLALQVPDTDTMTGNAITVSIINVEDWPTETVTLGNESNDVTVVE